MAWKRGCEIGKGSTATVSTAVLDGEILAVKSTKLSKSKFLQKEKQILSSLKSPYVVGYKGYDASNERNELYYNLFMEYIPGGTLADEIRRCGGRMDEQTIRMYTCQILRGAEYLHSNGIVHCDIKGSNILIREDEGVKLADFGCSKRVDDDAVFISGTPVYMAPETARGEEQGFQADIWAIGCTVIEMATGRPSWLDSGSDPTRILFKIAFSDQIPAFPSSSSLSDQGRDFLSKCLTRDPTQRWTATELLSHPFVTKVESFSKPNSISPTSILDNQLWGSASESDEEESMDMEVGSWEDDRIEEMAGVSGRPNWSSNEDWVPVRWESCSISQMKSRAGNLEDAGCCCVCVCDVSDLCRCSCSSSKYDPSISSLIQILS